MVWEQGSGERSADRHCLSYASGQLGNGPILRELGRPGEPRGARRGQTRVHPTSQVTVNTLESIRSVLSAGPAFPVIQWPS